MPLVEASADGGEQLRFIHFCDPTKILDEDGRTVSEQVPAISAPQFSGGSQAVSFDGGWLSLIHEARLRQNETRCDYLHRFVWFDETYRLAKVSRPFYFKAKGVEFAAGLAWHPDGKQLLISYGAGDQEAWIATASSEEVRAVLEGVQSFGSDALRQSGSEKPSRTPATMPERLQKNVEFTNVADNSKGNTFVQPESSWTPPAPAAGTELMIAGLRDRIPDALARIQLQVNLLPDNPSDEKPLVMWMHHDVNQNAVQWCRNRRACRSGNMFRVRIALAARTVPIRV